MDIKENTKFQARKYLKKKKKQTIGIHSKRRRVKNTHAFTRIWVENIVEREINVLSPTNILMCYT